MSNGGLDVSEHASSAPLMRVLYLEGLFRQICQSSLPAIGNMSFLPEKAYQ